MAKDFAGWNKLKQNLQQAHNLPTYNQREIWWCSIGVNLGHEEDGKNKLFQRPVVIIRKFNKHIFLGVPLTTQARNSPYYFPMKFRGREQSAMLSQIRIYDSKRLSDIMGKLAPDEFAKLRNAIKSVI